MTLAIGIIFENRDTFKAAIKYDTITKNCEVWVVKSNCKQYNLNYIHTRRK